MSCGRVTGTTRVHGPPGSGYASSVGRRHGQRDYRGGRNPRRETRRRRRRQRSTQRRRTTQSIFPLSRARHIPFVPVTSSPAVHMVFDGNPLRSALIPCTGHRPLRPSSQTIPTTHLYCCCCCCCYCYCWYPATTPETQVYPFHSIRRPCTDEHRTNGTRVPPSEKKIDTEFDYYLTRTQKITTFMLLCNYHRKYNSSFEIFLIII